MRSQTLAPIASSRQDNEYPESGMETHRSRTGFGVTLDRDDGRAEFTRAQSNHAQATRALAESRARYERTNQEFQRFVSMAAELRKRSFRTKLIVNDVRRQAEIARRRRRAFQRLLAEARSWEQEANRFLRASIHMEREARRKEIELRSGEEELRRLVNLATEAAKLKHALEPRPSFLRT